MFPNDFIESVTTAEETSEVGCDFLFDYETGQHIMKNAMLTECTVLQGIQQYIQNVLRTKINTYGVYTKGETDAFGVSIYNYLGTRTLPMAYLNSELKREVTMQLKEHPLIASVSEWTGERERQGLSIAFKVTLTDGSILYSTSMVSKVVSDLGGNDDDVDDTVVVKGDVKVMVAGRLIDYGIVGAATLLTDE
jgi:hypothetical protein